MAKKEVTTPPAAKGGATAADVPPAASASAPTDSAAGASSPTETTSGASAAAAMAAELPAMEFMPKSPTLRELLRDMETTGPEGRLLIAAAVPNFDYLVDMDGLKAEEALAVVRHHVEKAIAYLAVLDSKQAQLVPKLPEPERGPFRVIETRQVALHGGITTLPAGTIISVRDYGFEGIRALKEQGVKMEPVKQEA